MNFRYLILLPISLLVACSSEYGPGDFELSDKGVFVKKGSSSTLDGEVVIEKENGGSLIVEFDDGLPDGDVVMRDSDDKVVLKSSFVPKKDLSSSSGRGWGFLNEMISGVGGQLGTRDYLKFFEDFAEYDGDYLEVYRNKKTEGHYSNGEKDERWEVFCENGQIESDVTYKRFEEDDKQIIKKVGKQLSYNCDGDVLLSAERDKKGRLQGKYFEAQDQRYSYAQKESTKPLPQYERNYKDGELDGLQKEYGNDGALKVENNFKSGVQFGVEKSYKTQTDYSTREKVYGLHELKNYSSGQLHGSFSRYDINQKVILTGQYNNGKQVGLWTDVDLNKGTRLVTDFNADNFILDKSKAFKKACHLSTDGRVRWSNKKGQYDLTSCEYYVENNIVDINKKLGFDIYNNFEKSSKWSYLAIMAPPAVYEYVKKQGLNTRVVDRIGRTRLHMCIVLSRPSPSRSSCTTEQAISYVNDVDLNAVSNNGTVLHQLVGKRAWGTTKAFYIEEDIKIAQAIIAAGGNVNQLNYKNESVLMAALSNSEYAMANMLLDAGASIDIKDTSGRTTIGRMFIDGSGRWKSKKINAEGTRVLAKIIALGGDTLLPIKDGKTVVDFSEEHNTIHHIQTLKEAKAMSVEFSKDWKPKALEKQQPVTQSVITETASLSSVANKVVDDAVSTKLVDEVVPTQIVENSNVIEKQNVGGDGVQSEINTAQRAEIEASAQLSEVTQNVGSLSEQTPVDQESVSDGGAAALLREQADFLVEQANDHIKSSRLKTPKNNSALSSLEQLRRIDPKNENIALIEAAMGNKYLGLASGKINKGDKRGAQSYLNSANEFLQDKSAINGVQQRIDSYVAPVASTSNTQRSVSTSSNKAPALLCEPSARAAGVPVLGRTFTIKQSFPRSQSQILNTAKRVVQRSYSSVQQSSNKITYQQSTKGKPIKFTLTVKQDGNNTQLSIKAKTPAGLVTTKGAYKKAFCTIVAEL